MHQNSRYAGRTVALLTQHGKETAISPVLEPGLGCAIKLVTGFDTDQLGTFTRETPRPGTQLEAAIRKARKGMELSGATLGIASEGSFGSDPFTGMVPWNVELLVWVDHDLGVEIAGIAQGPTHSGYIQSSNWEEVAGFAKREGFPRQHLVLRPDGQNDTRIFKDICNWPRLKSCFDSCIAQSRNSEVFVELDLRAFANPSRMKNIELATADLLLRLQSPCPACKTSGYWISQRKPGLPCASCGLPTSTYRSEVWACVKCQLQQFSERQGRSHADPAHCSRCNPLPLKNHRIMTYHL